MTATGSGGLRRAKAIDDLRALDSTDSRKALAALAGSADDQLAALAMFAIARGGSSGERKTLEGIIEDGKRSDGVRSVALTAWCALKEKGGASWDDMKEYVDAKCDKNAALADTAAVVKKARFTTKGAK